MFAGVQRRAGQQGVRGVREAMTTGSTSGWTAASGEITVTSGRSRLTFSSSREATNAVQPRHRTDKRRVEGLTDESVANQGDIYRIVTHQVLHVVKRQQYYREGGVIPSSARGRSRKDGVAESGPATVRSG